MALDKPSAALLPPFYREGGGASIAKRAMRNDPTHRYRMIKRSKDGHNQWLKAEKGWEPVEGAELIKSLRLGNVRLNAEGRVQHMDTELWRMPTERAEAIREYLDGRTDARKSAPQAEMAALAADTLGRSGGKVQPYLSVGTAAGDVLEKQPLAPRAAKKE